jgi:hypothetical protein
MQSEGPCRQMGTQQHVLHRQTVVSLYKTSWAFLSRGALTCIKRTLASCARVMQSHLAAAAALLLDFQMSAFNA